MKYPPQFTRKARSYLSFWRVGIAGAGTVGLLGALLMSTIPGTTSTAFSFNWTGTPSSPQSVVPTGWDVQIHRRDPVDSMEAMDAGHGADCGAPPATHTITTLAQGVFICKNHLMTAIGDSGYGEIALTPDHLVDWSSGTASVKFSVSTLQLNNSDFLEAWLTPFSDNMTLPFSGLDPDLQGPPRNALRFSMNHDGPVSGTYEGDVARVDNFGITKLPKAITASLAAMVPPSAVVRTQYEIDISSNHIRFGLPALNLWWTDTNISPLPYSQAVLQLTHHSYNPNKHNPGLGVDTWHWSDVSISSSVPFTLINGAERSIHAGANAVHFAGAAPASAFLRFSGIGTINVSFDGGRTWQAAMRQNQVGTKPEHFSAYWTPIPAGVSSVVFSGVNWYGGPWWVRDPAIWSLTAPAGSGGAPAPNPSAAPPPPPAPTPMSINGLPCTVTINGTAQAGTCSGTFLPKQ